MARQRRAKRRRPDQRRASGRNLGLEATVIWGVVVLAWGYTGWAVYSDFVRQVHVHIYDALFLVDVAFLALAVWMTIEWRRTHRG